MLAYLAMRVGTGLVGLLPFRLAILLGQLAGRTFGRFGTGRRAMVERHARRLGVPEADVSSHVSAVFGAYGRYWAEALWVRPRRKEQVDAQTTVEGLHHLAMARDEHGGVIVVLPHMGNWEFASTVGTRLGLEVVAVAENLKNHRIRDWFLQMRTSMDIGIVLATGGRQVLRDLEDVIARKGVVALLCDRDLKGKGVKVEFFGETTTMPAGPASLALRTGAPILAAATYFADGGHHVVLGPPLDVPEGPDRSERIRATTQTIAHELEKLIGAAPEQWHLVQPNWPSDFEAAR